MAAPPIYLVRHAETTLNAARVVQYPDTPLSSHGRWQAGRLAAHLRRLGITQVVSSDYTRAHATATTICDATKATLTVAPILRERHLGELRGRPYSEVREQVFSEHFDPAKGETWADFTGRIDRLWTWVHEVRATAQGALAVVTHGLVCRALASRHFAVPGDAPLTFGNASVTIIDPEPPWRVRVMASNTYLDDDVPKPFMEEDD